MILGRCDKPTLKFLKQHFHYVVYTGLNGIDANFDQILCDGYGASTCAMEYLIGLGHRHIGYLGETSIENRYQGYLDCLEKHQLPFLCCPCPLFLKRRLSGRAEAPGAAAGPDRHLLWE